MQGAQRQLEEARRRWIPQPEMQWADFFLATGDAMAALYRREAAAGHRELEAKEPAFGRSLLARAAMARVAFVSIHGGCALAALRVSASKREPRAVAARCAKQLSKERIPHGPPFGLLLEAGLALDLDRPDQAVAALRAAIRGLDACDMAAYAACARRRLGQLLGGDEGHALITAGDAVLRMQGVQNLDATTEMLVPGCRPGSRHGRPISHADTI